MTEFVCRLGTPSGEIITRIVEATAANEARLRLETPEVLLHLDPTLDPTAYSGFFDVIVENSSQEPAFDVIFTEVPDLPVTGSRSTRDIGFLRHGIRHLAPGQKYRAFS